MKTETIRILTMVAEDRGFDQKGDVLQPWARTDLLNVSKDMPPRVKEAFDVYLASFGNMLKDQDRMGAEIKAWTKALK